MLSALLTIVITTLIVTYLTSYVMLRKAVSNGPFRRILMLFVFITPFIVVFAAIKALFFSKPKPLRYSADLGRIEDQIEAERAQIFETEIIHPSFSYRWKMSYLYAVEKSAAAASHIPAIGDSLCGISQF